MESAYELLGVDIGATPEEVRRAYRAQVLANHPDRNPDMPDANQRLMAIRAAYEWLTAAHAPGDGLLRSDGRVYDPLRIAQLRRRRERLRRLFREANP